jgi:Xaa-Pro dipeptidase
MPPWGVRMNTALIQARMREEGVGGWLVHDFRGSNPVLERLLPGRRWTTRRAVLMIPLSGEPRLLVHGIDAGQFAGVPACTESYLSWRELHGWLERHVTGAGRVAMEYSPGGHLPVASIVDAGTVEFVRSLGVDVVSSADLVQTCVAVWSPAARRAHGDASRAVAAIKDAAFTLIRERVAAGRTLNEREVQQDILSRFEREGLETSEPPIVAVNAHSGDPHFEVSATDPAPIRRGDWVLIDLWARRPGDDNIYSDITWVGFCGPEAPGRHREAFAAVKSARDATLNLARRAWEAGERLQGWMLDDAARNVLVEAGFERFVRHRTGHSLSPGPKVHGLGVNLDNLETRDTRLVLPGLGYTIEPGVYLPEFGVRSEINVFTDPDHGPEVTSCIQDEVVPLG